MKIIIKLPISNILRFSHHYRKKKNKIQKTIPQKSNTKLNYQFISVCTNRGTMRLLPLQLTAEDTAITHFDGTPESRIELSEAECDIDTLKKLKLGMRSSLWSRPANPTPDNGTGGGGGGTSKMPVHPSDYSIAV